MDHMVTFKLFLKNMRRQIFIFFFWIYRRARLGEERSCEYSFRHSLHVVYYTFYGVIAFIVIHDLQLRWGWLAGWSSFPSVIWSVTSGAGLQTGHLNAESHFQLLYNAASCYHPGSESHYFRKSPFLPFFFFLF